MKRIAIGIILLGISTGGFALRCGNQIVSEGDSEYKIRKMCSIEEEYIVNNEQADVKVLYIPNGGMMNELTIVDGKLQSIEGHRS